MIESLRLSNFALFVSLSVMLMPSAEAAVILEVLDDGTDLTLTWTGTLNILGSVGSVDSSNQDVVSPDSNTIGSVDGSNFFDPGVGTRSANDPWIAGLFIDSPSTGVGSGLAFSQESLVWDDSFGAAPGLISPTRSWTVPGETVASAFGSNLDGGPVLLWTHNTTNDTISIGLAAAAVPEPSTTLALGIGALGMAAGHRRRKRQQTA